MRIKILTTLFSLFFCQFINCQDLHGNAMMDGQGKSLSFVMGEVNEKQNYTSGIGIRANKTINQAIAKVIEKGEKYSVDFERSYYGNSILNESFSISLSKTTDNNCFNCPPIDSRLEKRTIHFKSLYSLGQLPEDFKGYKKITDLNVCLSLGRQIDFSKYKKVKSIYSQNIVYPIALLPKNCPDNFEFIYPGDPFLYEDVSKLVGLEFLSLTPKTSHRYMGLEGNIYCLDGVPPKLFELPKLKYIRLEGPPYLPVNFFSFEKLEYLELSDISSPELINLALILNHFGKDTTKGNWSEYLKSGQKNLKLDLKLNGEFETFYSSGQRLCQGEFRDGEPQGIWRFWYENGSLCQERSYQNGKRQGIWKFYRPDENKYVGEDKFVHLFNYVNDTLLFRKDYLFGYESFGFHCRYAEFEHELKFTTEYKLNWRESRNLDIEKSSFSQDVDDGKKTLFERISNDTLDYFTEKWSFTNSTWTYDQLIKCKVENFTEIIETRRSGLIGCEPSYQSKKRMGPKTMNSIIFEISTNRWEFKEFLIDAFGKYNLSYELNGRIE